MVFYFSGTGNSKWIANQLSKELQEELVFIPEALNGANCNFSLKEGEKIGFVFPIYSWAPPKIVLRFISQLMIEGYQNQYLYFICSCGDDTGLVRQVFEEALRAKGWRCDAGFSVTMPNSYVLLPGFDVDDKVLEGKKLSEAVSALDGIISRVRRGEKAFVCNEGSFPFMKTRIINPLFNRFQMSPRKFYAADSCIGCKLCVKSCPVGNVSFGAGKPIWGMECTSCLACYHVCPQQAVQYGKRTRDKGQYFNPNV